MDWLKDILNWFIENATELAILGSALAGSFSIYRYMSERKERLYWKEFDTYHSLVKQLVQGDEPLKPPMVDRQTAVIFELRAYKRHYEHTSRMLEHLKTIWDNERVLEEIESTLAHIRSK